MRCHQVQDCVAPLLDGTLVLPEREAVQRHLTGCAICRTALAAEQQLRQALRQMPIEPASPAFAARALRTARGQERHSRPAFAAGFASAMVAGLLLWGAAGLWFSGDVAQSSLPEVVLTIDQPRTVNLVFDAPGEFSNATLALSLPEQTELEGFPGQRELIWQTNLHQGQNLLALPLIARDVRGGELIATLVYGNKQKTFRLQMDVQPRRQGQFNRSTV